MRCQGGASEVALLVAAATTGDPQLDNNRWWKAGSMAGALFSLLDVVPVRASASVAGWTLGRVGSITLDREPGLQDAL